jgi:UDPglucose 6-dehydrogenase
VVEVNDTRKKKMVQKIIDACGGSVSGKRIAVLGLAFKPHTDDMRDAPSLDILPALQKAGAEIIAYDPESMAQAKALLPGIVFADSAYACMDGADALVIVTEWNAFRALDLKRIKLALKAPIVVDLRNIYRPAEMKELGFAYHGVGR